MPTTPNLGIDHVEPNQSQPDVVVDAAFDALDQAQTDMLEQTITSSHVTLTDAQALTCIYIRVTGAFTANRNLVVPTANKPYVVEHSGTGGYTLTVKTSGGTGVAITQGTTVVVYCDGTNVVQATGATGAGGNPYDLSFSVEGQPGSGGLMVNFVCPRALRLPASLTNSQGYAAVAGTVGNADFDIKKNGSSVGTIRFATSATTATFIKASDTDYAAGDLLTITAPSPQNATLADVTVTLAGTRL